MRTLGTREIYRNRWMKLREDEIQREDGSESVYAVVEKPEFALIIPHQDGVLHMVQQYRYPIASRQWEFPQGTLEGVAEATPLQIAQTELVEETGLIASSIVCLGSLYPAYGLLNQKMHVFLAEELVQGEREFQADESDLITQPFSVKEVRRMIRYGELVDGCSVAAMYLWDNR